MTTSSTAAPTLACPEWCTGSHTPADFDDVDGSRYHPGPRFGSVEFSGITASDGRLRSFAADVDSRDMATVADLRQLAAEALAAAEWLETRR